MNRKSSPCAVVLVCVLLSGCASTDTEYSRNGKPVEREQVTQLRTIDAKIDYTGNRDYLPRSLKEGADTTDITAVYTYDVSYDAGRERDYTIVNPLLIAGVTKAADSVTVTGTLELFRAGNSIRKYSESVALRKNKTLYSEGETLSEMRRDGLLFVRDSIDRQIYNDRGFWDNHTENGQVITRPEPVKQ